MLVPQKIALDKKHVRIIPSIFPPINFFEDLVDPKEMEILWEIESLTNERIRQEIGDLFLVPIEDRMSGPGSSIVMAAFTHIGRPSRFTDGSYGVYYAGLSKKTAIKETVFHRERFLLATHEEACEITMRLYEGKIIKPLHDIRNPTFNSFHDPNDYAPSQLFGQTLRETQSWGLVYNSVRDQNGECIAIFRPPAISDLLQISHLRYIWNGKKITDILDTQRIIL